MRYAYDTSDENEASRIKVENMKSDLLIMAPEADDMWSSEKAVPRMERILKEAGYPYRIKAIIYRHASHLIGADMGSVLKSPIARKMFCSMMPAEKKYPKECEAARADSMKQILEFLKEW